MLLNRRPEIDRFLSAPGRTVRAAIIHGRDHGVVRERAETLAKAATDRPDDPFDVARLTQGDIAQDDSRLEGELVAVSMMGGRRLIRLQLSEDVGGAERTRVERITAEALGRHLAGELNPEALLLIESPALRGDSPLLKIGKDAPACAVIPCYEDEPGELKLMVRTALAAEGLSLTADALDLFVSRLPRDRGVARQEIERLTLYLGPGAPGQPGPDQLAAFLGVEPEASLGEAALHAFGGRLGAAHAELRRAAQEGEGGIAAVRALSLHLGKLRRVATAKAAGAAPQAAVRTAGVFWKSEREVLRQAGAWTLAELAGPQGDILEVEMACKRRGSRAPDQLLAERLAFGIAGRARKLGL
jgi:DNA polymerase-3 subunit delta